MFRAILLLTFLKFSACYDFVPGYSALKANFPGLFAKQIKPRSDSQHLCVLGLVSLSVHCHKAGSRLSFKQSFGGIYNRHTYLS